MTEEKQGILNLGTAQTERFLEALDFDYVKIDERSFEDFLVFAERLSHLFKFYNLKNEPDGDWSPFLNDETITLAAIIDTDVIEIENRFKNNLDRSFSFLDTEKKLASVRRCVQEIFNLALRFDYWLERLVNIGDIEISQNTIKSEISNAISTKLRGALQKLISLQKGGARKDTINLKLKLEYEHFQSIWETSKIKTSVKFYQGTESQNQKIDRLAFQLTAVFQPFYDTLIYLRRKAPEFIQQSLKKNTHHPEVTLYMVFLKLYRFPQKNLNDLTRKYLEFYYNDVLRLKNREHILDKVYLKLTAEENILFTELPKGTEFIAGEDDDGNDILYATDYDFQVNRGVISKLYTLYINNQILNVRGVEKELISNIYSADLPVHEVYDQDEGQKEPISYATFGENQSEKGAYERTMADAEIGFAISSPSLYLSEGQREITITLVFAEQSFDHLKQYLEDLSFTTQNTQKEVFIKTFLEAFHIYITAEEDWYSISRYVVIWDMGKPEIKIRFDMEENEPAIVKFNPDIHGGSYSSELPIVKFILNSNAFVYPYSLLKGLLVEQFIFETQVYGVKNLLLNNHIGALSPDSPFFPFGPLPNVGSYLLIGNNEVFQKSLNSLAIKIQWFDLPRHRSGFFGHYEQYGVGIDNTKFEISLSILDNGRWKPLNEAEQQIFKLFRTTDKGEEANPQDKGTLNSTTVISNIDTTIIKQPANYSEIESELFYTNIARRGFIKLEMVAPAVGFAYDLYPNALAEFTASNGQKGGVFSKIGKLINKSTEAPKPPSPPYAPQIQKISLDYSSSSVISLTDRSVKPEKQGSRGEFFHIHPFGETLIYPDTSRQNTPLIPSFSFEGSLMMGFSDLTPPQRLSILFEMIDEFTISSEQEPPILEWSYLVENEWKTLEPSRIIRDTTEGFLKTGIIELSLPFDLKNGNTILDPDLYWIKIAVLGNIDEASNIVAARTQVLTASLVGNNDLDSHLQAPLPAETIIRPLNRVLGLSSVLQPLPSFQGKLKESSKDFYVRTGERLRHKNRAITSWDYERLILSEFPEIFQVTCLGNMTSRNLDSPGNVLLVVVPKADLVPKVVMPMASNELLYDIKEYIQQLISPFIKLEVRNPEYEKVKIMCHVKFIEGYNFGFYLQRLNEDINEYIAGNGTQNHNRMLLGASINNSDVLSFIRTLPYVDFITGFSMIQSALDFRGKHMLIDTADPNKQLTAIKATKPWSVLIPNMVHQIDLINEKTAIIPKAAGVTSLEIGLDFIIH